MFVNGLYWSRILFFDSDAVSPDFEQVKEELMKLGATYVLSDEDLTKVETREWFAQPGMKNHIKLGLNSVGGKQAVEMAKSLKLVSFANLHSLLQIAREALWSPMVTCPGIPWWCQPPF